jgi:CRISPR/Cas system CSM-associated protein Csm3 (group 7 of RAMP superfamily)
MRHLLQSVIGTPGPLIVEADGKVFFEQCMTIRECHVDKMYERVKDVNPSKIIQTSDRSFHFSCAPSPPKNTTF